MRSLFVGGAAALFLFLSLSLLVSPRPAFGFGGEDVLQGNPWHHEDITRRGLTKSDLYEGAGFSAAAANAIAWHADYIDSYLYNPLFWTQGVAGDRSFARLDAALAGYADLAKLHFDDTFTTSGLRANWERYASGTLAGLYWASLQDASGDVAAGQNILGVSFHAVQDFYSHSNWVDDPQRRCMTWLQTPSARRSEMALYSGAYELPKSGAPKHHGAYSLSCSLVRGDTLDKALDPICTGYSPFQNTALCEEWRLCRGGKAVTISVKGEQNDKLVFLDPPGIALDTTWLSRVQAVNRGLVDSKGTFAPGKDGMHFRREACVKIVKAPGREVCTLDADQAFAGTKDLAIRATKEWAEYLEAAMQAMGPRQAAFWARLKQEGSNEAIQARQYEDFSKLPYQFLAAGPYPIGNPSVRDREGSDNAGGWYLRLRVKTARTPLAETDADIHARIRVNGKDEDRLLDYLPTDDKKGRTSNKLLVYDDFESGRDTVYMLGPFSARPESIALRNDGGSSKEALTALFQDFAKSASGAVTRARRALITIVAGEADYVGDAAHYRTFAQIAAKFAASDPRFPSYEEVLRVDGRDEGVHDITYRVRSLPANLTADEKRQGWLAMEVELRKLKTVKESKIDRPSPSDEPFVIFHTAPLNGRAGAANTYLSDPIPGMDRNDEHVFARRTGSAYIVKVPPGGGFVVSAQVFESDSESAGDRQQLARTFASGFDEQTRAPAAKFADEIGRLFGADWTPDFIEVFAFKRGAVPEAGPVLRRRPLAEVRGDQVSEVLRLDWSQVRALSAQKFSIDEWAAKPVDAKVLDGVWHAQGYDCEGPIEYDSVDVAIEGAALQAKKLNGTKCAVAGAASWRGTFKDGVVTGEFYKASLPATGATAETPPNYEDKAIDPMIGLEGNWIIRWENTAPSEAYAVLSKGPGYSCVNAPEGGCWSRFWRDAKAPWRVGFTYKGTGKSAGGAVTLTAAGQVSVEYGYGVLGHWGGKSIGGAQADSIASQWAYGDQKGRETWTRVHPEVSEVESRSPPSASRRRLGDPVTVTVPYSGPGNDLRGNRPTAELRLYGRDLWGLQRYWMGKESGVEIGSLWYVCAKDDKGALAETSDSSACLAKGGVAGVVLPLVIWPDARSGPKVIRFNDQDIPFNLVVTDEPAYGWRPMKLKMESCAVLREIDPPKGEAGLVFLRSDFRRK